MNIHPLLVHFPIATFYIYAVIEIFALDKRFHSLLGAKRLLLSLSLLFGILSVNAGDAAQEALRIHGGIVQYHEKIAVIFCVITGLLTLGMIGAIIKGKNIIMMNWWQKLLSYFAFLGSRPIRLFLAILGFIAVTITGALGGLIIYGPSTDPLSTWLYGIINK